MLVPGTYIVFMQYKPLNTLEYMSHLTLNMSSTQLRNIQEDKWNKLPFTLIGCIATIKIKYLQLPPLIHLGWFSLSALLLVNFNWKGKKNKKFKK